MQGYTYTKGEHYPVEHLVFKVAPEDVEHYLAVDHEIWKCSLTKKNGKSL